MKQYKIIVILLFFLLHVILLFKYPFWACIRILYVAKMRKRICC